MLIALFDKYCHSSRKELETEKKQKINYVQYSFFLLPGWDNAIYQFLLWVCTSEEFYAVPECFLLHDLWVSIFSYYAL